MAIISRRISVMFFCLTFSVLMVGQEERKIVNSRNQKNDTLSISILPEKQVKGIPVAINGGNNEIKFDKDASLKFLQKIYSSTGIWKKSSDPLREAIGVLLYNAVRPPIDSTTFYLSKYDYGKLRLPLDDFYVLDSVRIILPVIRADSLAGDTLSRKRPDELFIKAGKNLEKVMLTEEEKPVTGHDTLFLNDSVYILMKEFVPETLPRRSNDTIVLVITDTLPEPSIRQKEYPFRYTKSPFLSDSIDMAVRTLINYLADRDSTLVTLKGENGWETNVWLNGKTDELKRFWLYDGKSDSVTVWVGSSERNTLNLSTEEGILFKKQIWHDQYADTRVNVTTAREEALRKVDLLKIKPVLWNYRTDASYQLSQGWVENWAKGGENNISSVLDVTEYIDYNNKVSKVTANTSVRFALGFQASGKKLNLNDIRKNLDLIEINSKINHKAFGKFDLSGVLQFKTQTLPGYNYPNDSVKVSKFFNPATLILGYGLDYKPDKNTSINVSPISYKGTYVPDTAMINQTKYGIGADRRSKNELGAYVTVSNKTRLFDKIDMTNKIQFFSNFLSKPQNVDVDWEMIMTMSLNWFTDLRMNMHLIYDDNTRFPVYDDEGNPVIGTGGVQKTAPKAQFKELLGLSLAFKF